MPKKDKKELMAEANLLSMGIADSLSILYSYNSTCRNDDDIADVSKSDMMIYVIQVAAEKLRDIIGEIDG